MGDPKPCNCPGCIRPSRAGGMCAAHYRRSRRGASTATPIDDRALEYDQRLTVRLTGAQLAALRSRAETAGHDVGSEVRAALDAWVRR